MERTAWHQALRDLIAARVRAPSACRRRELSWEDPRRGDVVGPADSARRRPDEPSGSLPSGATARSGKSRRRYRVTEPRSIVPCPPSVPLTALFSSSAALLLPPGTANLRHGSGACDHAPGGPPRSPRPAAGPRARPAAGICRPPRPPGEIRNFSKFHVMSPASPSASVDLVSSSYIGWRSGTVHLDLLEHRERDAVGRRAELGDLLGCARLLAQELVAREPENREPRDRRTPLAASRARRTAG